MPERQTTTVEVKGNTYKALDRIRNPGDSFDDAIKTLIENTAAGMQGFTADAPSPDVGELEPLPEDASADKQCAEFDPVTGEMCENAIAYRQPYSYGSQDDGAYFYYCEEHKPEELS